MDQRLSGKWRWKILKTCSRLICSSLSHNANSLKITLLSSRTRLDLIWESIGATVEPEMEVEDDQISSELIQHPLEPQPRKTTLSDLLFKPNKILSHTGVDWSNGWARNGGERCSNLFWANWQQLESQLRKITQDNPLVKPDKIGSHLGVDLSNSWAGNGGGRWSNLSWANSAPA